MNEQRSSDQQFRVGEIAIVARTFEAHWLLGKEVTILEGPRMNTLRYGGLCMAYKIDVVADDGKNYWVREIHLRKKPPPGEGLKVVSWDQCPWQPERIHG